MNMKNDDLLYSTAPKCSGHGWRHSPWSVKGQELSLWLKVENNMRWLNSLVVLDKHSASLKGMLASEIK